MKAYSPALPSLRVIMECVRWDHDFGASSWYARVPTDANIGDGPSRMYADEVFESLDGILVAPVFPVGQTPVRVLC